MAQELQSLLDRIQKDGVEKADAEAQRIIDEAKTKAKQIVSDAESQAATIRQQANTDGEAFAQRGRVALEQAARDVVISVGDSINRALRAIVRDQVSAAMDTQTVSAMLVKLAEAYGTAGTGTRRVEALLPVDQQEAITQHFLASLRDATAKGLTLKGDGQVLAGFRISLVDDHVEHDFSEAAITDALCELLRPHISEILKKAVQPTD